MFRRLIGRSVFRCEAFAVFVIVFVGHGFLLSTLPGVGDACEDEAVGLHIMSADDFSLYVARGTFGDYRESQPYFPVEGWILELVMVAPGSEAQFGYDARISIFSEYGNGEMSAAFDGFIGKVVFVHAESYNRLLARYLDKCIGYAAGGTLAVHCTYGVHAVGKLPEYRCIQILSPFFFFCDIIIRSA